MPTYQYVCTECGEPLEAVQKFSDDALTECPNCGGRLRKVFSAAAIVFKGSGFYRNDSRGKSTTTTPAKADAKSDSGSSESSNGSSDTKTETKKTETKSESSSGSSEKVA